MSAVLKATQVSVAGRLAPLSLELTRGSLHALVGPNGSGKSTFIDSVLGLCPCEGRLELDHEMRLALVPQRLEGLALLPLTVLEYLSMSRSGRPTFFGVSGAVRQSVSRALSVTGVEGLLGARLSALSGGELRRVLLADALDVIGQSTGLLILDEPEAGLDEASRQVLLETLAQLPQRGVSTLWVSHDAEAVRRLATHTTTLSVPRG